MSAASKTALVLGVANGRSIAWACVRSLLSKNYNVIVTYQNERFHNSVQTLIQSETCAPGQFLKAVPCQVETDIPSLFEQILPNMLPEEQSHLDAIVHSIAYAPPDAMKEGSLLQTTRQSFAMAHDISSFSFLEVARHSLPLLNSQAASLTTLSYLGATRSVPNYNVMGPAKASLEAIVRGLALELGPRKIRVNAVSAGPMATLAARGIAGFSDMRTDAEQRAPLRRNVTVDEVAETVAFVATNATGITGQTIYVDGGYSIVAGPAL